MKVNAAKVDLQDSLRANLCTTAGTPVPLLGVELSGTVFGGHAAVCVRQRFRNAEPSAIEAIYTFPLPSNGILTAFRMETPGRRSEGVVKEREEAFATYDDAIVAGHGAALLDQERKNVFTAQVGNLLPGEETLIELEYLQPVSLDEGSLRFVIPTLVAPRYIPGTPQGPRTAHGSADPTDRVPDADRITPPIAPVDYGVKLDLWFDLGAPVAVESPSHALQFQADGHRTRVKFATVDAPLDRDIVLLASSKAGALTGAVCHRGAANPQGYVALTVFPDLFDAAGASPARGGLVTFVVDISGSMDGASLPQAKAALRLCLRHLREGDRFQVIAFDDRYETFRPEPVPFSQRTLEEADRWVDALAARGGTELLAPLLCAVGQGEGVVVLLTDGQVGNEAEILSRVLAESKGARIYPFGIGTNVSDGLLRDLAEQTAGHCEFIYPGERIDEKVVAQFSRSLAPRVEKLSMRLSNLEFGEVAPAALPPLVDGEPWTLFARYDRATHGWVELSGEVAGRPWSTKISVDLEEVADRPHVAKLWAKARIKELETAEVKGRRGQAMKDRIIKLAVDHQLATAYTSFVVVETREGDRRQNAQPETRVVPVNAPAGWAMFEKAPGQARGGKLLSASAPFVTYAAAAPKRSRGLIAGAAADVADLAAAALGGLSRKKVSPAEGGGGSGSAKNARRDAPVEKRKLAQRPASAAAPLPPPPAQAPAPAMDKKADRDEGDYDDLLEAESNVPLARVAEEVAEYRTGDGGNPLYALLGRQLASGLWTDGGTGDEALVRGTARALLTLLDAGVTTAHAELGAQVKKAVEALLQLGRRLAASRLDLAELAFGVAYLLASGKRSRGQVESAVRGASGLATLQAQLGDEGQVRERVRKLAGV